jgi:branched-chain amino acid transport system permease protein
MNYLMVVATTICIFAIQAVALNIVVGYVGQPNFAESAFLGIGAYAAAIMSTRYGAPFFTTIPISLLVTGVVGFALGVVSLRLRDDFLAIVTIGLNFVVVAVFQYVPFFGGAVGIFAIPLPTVAGYQFGNSDFLIVGLVMLAVVVLVSRLVERSWFGGSLIAIKDSEQAAASIGIPVASYKVAAFTLSAALSGLAGSLYAPFISAVTPSSFGLSESMVILAMVFLGGVGTIRGALFGALVLGALPEVFRFTSNYRLLVFGLVLVLVLRFQPQGLLGEDSALMRAIRRVRRKDVEQGLDVAAMPPSR